MDKSKLVVFGFLYDIDNAGDFAINLGSLDLLSNFHDNIVIIAKPTKNDENYNYIETYIKKYYPTYRLLEGPFSLNRKNRLSTFLSYLMGALKTPFHYSVGKYVEEIKNSTLVYLNGGNVLRCESKTDYIRLQAILFPIKLASKYNKKYILLPHSTTKINKKGDKLLRPIFDRSKLFLVREKISFDKLSKKYPDANIKHSLDSAFFIKDRINLKEETEEKYPFIGENSVCITLRKEDIGDIGELDAKTIDIIERDITHLVKELIESNNEIVFVVQTKKDKEFTEKLYKKLSKQNDKVHFVEEYDPLILREIYRKAKCLVGMRLHSIILSMSVGTPVVGYFDEKWGIKNPGTLTQFKMPFKLIDDNSNLFSYYRQSIENKDMMDKVIEEFKKETLLTFESIFES